MADSSFPRRPKSSGGKGGRVLEFPSEPVPDGAPEDSAAQSAERPRAEVVVFPRQAPTTGKRAAVREPSGAHRRPQAPIEAPATDTVPDVERPPYLATELLREDLAPRFPWAAPLRWASLAGGVLAILIAVGLGGFQTAAMAMAGIGALCTLAGALPVRPVVRGWVVVVAGASGIGVAGWSGIDLLLGVIGALVVGALLFRAAHRTSMLARVLVGIALAGMGGWWVLDGGIGSLVIQSAAWHDVLAPISTLVLVLLGTLTTLTFLDPLGTGGARRLAIGWWAAVAIHFGVGLALELGPNPQGINPNAAARLATPIFVALVGLSLPQVVASVLRRAFKGERAAK
jgi:hypothetical protein